MPLLWPPVPNKLLRISLSPDSYPWESVEVTLYIPVDSTFQALQNHLFCKLRKAWPSEKSSVHCSRQVILCLFSPYLRGFSQKNYELNQNQCDIRNQHRKLVRAMHISNHLTNFFFHRKFSPTSPQDLLKKRSTWKHGFCGWIFCHFVFYSYFTTLELLSHY